MHLILQMRRLARQVRFPLLLAAVMAYFVFHLVQGDRGLRAWVDVTRELAYAEERLAAVEAERARLENRVELLNVEHLDGDMIEEQARRSLNYGWPGDRVIVLTPGAAAD